MLTKEVEEMKELDETMTVFMKWMEDECASIGLPITKVEKPCIDFGADAVDLGKDGQDKADDLFMTRCNHRDMNGNHQFLLDKEDHHTIRCKLCGETFQFKTLKFEDQQVLDKYIDSCF